MAKDKVDPRGGIAENVRKHYEKSVLAKYTDSKGYWPVISGCDVKIGHYADYWIFIYVHTGSNVCGCKYPGEASPELLGTSQITEDSIPLIRTRLEKHYRLKKEDAVFIVKKDMSNLDSESAAAMEKHEYALGHTPMKIFLSHKGIDKPRVREFKEILSLLGFEPWFDEDALKTGVELERGLLQGFKESCAAVFFITPHFQDEKYLASEINYAIAEKREKGNKFSIITLLFEENGQKGQVPDLLKTYVWKEPKTDIEALQEIIKALPIKVGDIYWK